MIRLPDAPNLYSQQWASDLIRSLNDDRNRDIQVILRSFTITGYTVSRTLDATTATATDIANFLGTLVQDIKKVRSGG